MKTNSASVILIVTAMILAVLQSPALPVYYPEDPKLERLKEMPPEFFTDREKLEEWTETSTWGGGKPEDIEGPEGERVIAVYRSYTSGVRSADLTVYAWQEAKGLWMQVIHRRPIYGDFIKAESKGDRIIFRTAGGGEALLDLPFNGLASVTTRETLRELEILSMVEIEPGK